MTHPFTLPPTGFGPGSQPLDHGDEALDYMTLPQNMRTYVPRLPDVEKLGDADLAPALDLLRAVAAAATRVGATGGSARFPLSGLDAESRRLVAETLGSGEVSAKLHAIPAVAVQESVFAGIWTLLSAAGDAIEVAAVPVCLTEAPHRASRPGRDVAALTAPGLASAPSVLVELKDRSAGFDLAAPLHVVNLTLLPHTEADLMALDAALGQGAVTILSRGYGNCRITATALAHVWRVQFFNSQDHLILDTFEVTAMPEVACAASEDLSDSGKRLASVIEAIQ